ncbi:MAG: hypothetical protein NZ660_11300 [Oscillatoriaceae bacterium SKYG93]|nr:hypothetical protein [Oscillatoriaceae bacterium SKYG93]MDW8454029.1 hypothetical protein [Oscillatoriaceae cyanobacterium SKYGB_i_bin93]
MKEVKQLNQDIEVVEKSVKLINLIEEYKNNIKKYIEYEVNILKNKAKTDVNRILKEEENAQKETKDFVIQNLINIMKRKKRCGNLMSLRLILKIF